MGGQTQKAQHVQSALTIQSKYKDLGQWWTSILKCSCNIPIYNNPETWTEHRVNLLCCCQLATRYNRAQNSEVLSLSSPDCDISLHVNNNLAFLLKSMLALSAHTSSSLAMWYTCGWTGHVTRCEQDRNPHGRILILHLSDKLATGAGVAQLSQHSTQK